MEFYEWITLGLGLCVALIAVILYRAELDFYDHDDD